jgi:hypothetical protein
MKKFSAKTVKRWCDNAYKSERANGSDWVSGKSRLTALATGDVLELL